MQGTDNELLEMTVQPLQKIYLKMHHHSSCTDPQYPQDTDDKLLAMTIT